MFYREQKRGHTRPMCGDYEKSFSSSWWTMNTLCTWKIKMTVRLFLQLMQKKKWGGCGGDRIQKWFRKGWNVLFKIIIKKNYRNRFFIPSLLVKDCRESACVLDVRWSSQSPPMLLFFFSLGSRARTRLSGKGGARYHGQRRASRGIKKKGAHWLTWFIFNG